MVESSICCCDFLYNSSVLLKALVLHDLAPCVHGIVSLPFRICCGFYCRLGVSQQYVFALKINYTVFLQQLVMYVICGTCTKNICKNKLNVQNITAHDCRKACPSGCHTA